MAQLDADQYLQLTKDVTYGQDNGVYWDKTNSKIALVVADTVVAEFSAAGFSAEELVLASQAQGDLMRFGGTDWEVLPAATAGQVVLGDGTDVISAAMSNDATIGAAGALTLAAQWRTRNATTDVTAGAYTYLIAGMKLGVYLRDPTGGDRNDVTDTAANIVAGLLVAAVGSFVDFVVINTADADETITLTAAAGVTLSPAAPTVSRGQAGFFRAVVTNAGTAAVTIYQLSARQIRGHVLIGDAAGQRRSLPPGAASTILQTDSTDTAWVALSQDATLAAGVMTLADEFRTRNTTIDTTAGAYTYLVAGMLLGHYKRDPTGAARTDVTDTAANIVAGYTGAAVGSFIDFVITNTADADETITLTGGAGVTLDPTAQYIKRGESCWFRVRMDNVTGAAEAVTVYKLSTSAVQSRIATTDATAGAYTYLTAGMLLGHYLRDPAGGDRSDVTDSAANIVAGFPNAVVGSFIDFVITNTADADETVTLTAGAGVTLSPTAQKISRGESCLFRARMDNVTGSSEAVTVYQLGSRQIRGHILIGDSTGQRRELPPGTTGQVVGSDGTDVAWASIVTSWGWAHGAPSGEDTDAAGTNGGGILGGAAVDLTTHQFNNSGGNVYVKCYDGSAWDDLSTSALLTDFAANYQLLPDAASETAGDAFAIGFDNQFCEVCFNDLATGGGALATWGANGGKWQYSTGAGTWSDLTVFDNTDTAAQDGLQSLVQAGSISFAPPSNWVVATYDGQEAYWIQYVVTAEQLTQTPLIDDTNKDEPFVCVPDAHTFIAPHDCTIDAIRVTNLHDTVHDQAIKFVVGAFTEIKPAAGFSLSAELTWDASVRVERFDLSSRKPVIAAGQRIGICVTDDGGSTNNPVFAVDLLVTLT